jgi:hypothetical protein
MGEPLGRLLGSISREPIEEYPSPITGRVAFAAPGVVVLDLTLTDAEVDACMRHANVHAINYCKCPCFGALLRLGREMMEVHSVARKD